MVSTFEVNLSGSELRLVKPSGALRLPSFEPAVCIFICESADIFLMKRLLRKTMFCGSADELQADLFEAHFQHLTSWPVPLNTPDLHQRLYEELGSIRNEVRPKHRCQRGITRWSGLIPLLFLSSKRSFGLTNWAVWVFRKSDGFQKTVFPKDEETGEA